MPGPGDEVCVLLGYDQVILLRPHISGRRQVVERAYVYGLMSTEGVLGPLPKGWETKQWSGDGTSEWVYKDSETETITPVDPRPGTLPDRWEIFPHEGFKDGSIECGHMRRV